MTHTRPPRQNDHSPCRGLCWKTPVALALLGLVLIWRWQLPLPRAFAAETVPAYQQGEISPLATPTTGITHTPATLPEAPASGETRNTPESSTTTPTPSATPPPTLTSTLEPSPSPQPPEPSPNALPLIVEPPTPIPAPLVVVAPLSPLRGASGGLSPDGGSLLWVGAVGLLLLAGSSLMFVKRQK